jgi:hypothetical protein
LSATIIRRNAVLSRSYALKGPLLVLALSLVSFAISRRALVHVALRWEFLTFLLVCAAFVGALAFSSVRYRDMSPAMRVVVRGIGMIVFIQMSFDAFGPFAGPPNILFGSGPHVLFFRYAAILAVISGAAAIWRPAFLFPLFYFYVGWRELIGAVSGVPIVATDYLGMLDGAYFCIVGVFMTVVLTSSWMMRRFPAWSGWLIGPDGIEAFRSRTFGLLWSCAVGAHLGNYFWSGMKKIAVGYPEPWTWLLQNPTENSILIGLERGDNPLAQWPAVLQLVWDGIRGGQPFMNIFVLGVQLAAPLAAISLPVLSIFCLLFDMFHIGVYLTLGALFFFWIAVNLIIVASAARVGRENFTPAMKVVMVLTTLFGYHAFYTNYLGWLDAAKLASPQFLAKTRDGREIPVPSNYFGIFSYTIAQTGMYIPDNHFMSRTGGNHEELESWKEARSCGPAIVEHQDTGVSLQSVEDLVHQTDRLMREHPAVKDLNLYYLYPHHMLPNPWMYTAFNGLKMDDIVGYEYVIDSVCLNLRDGKLVRDVRKRSIFPIDVR